MTEVNTAPETEVQELTMDLVEQELIGISKVLGSHEQTIFHLIVVANAVQRLFIDKNLADNEDLKKVIQEEATKLKQVMTNQLKNEG